MNFSPTHPIMQFFRLVDVGKAPQRADRSAEGLLYQRAVRYCEAATVAAAFGWYVFPPIAFSLLWDGHETLWTHDGASDWFPLGAAQYPNFREKFDRSAPNKIKGYSPPFLAAFREPGVIQVWTGVIVQTRPGWSYLVRGPANMPRAAGYDVLEGVVEADRWLGPLFVNVRLTRTGSIIQFDPHFPLSQVQPLSRESYSDAVLNNVSSKSIESMNESEWDAYFETVVEPSQRRCAHGEYATAVRKRRRDEMRLSED